MSSETKNSRNTISGGGPIHVGDRKTKIINNINSAEYSSIRLQVLKCMQEKGELQNYIADLAVFLTEKSEETVIGLKAKLTDAGYTDILDDAILNKEEFAKFLAKNMYSLSFQKVIHALIHEALSVFRNKIRPQMTDGEAQTVIMRAIHDEIFEPLHQAVADIEQFEFNKSRIEGLVYFITGNCYLRWSRNATV